MKFSVTFVNLFFLVKIFSTDESTKKPNPNDALSDVKKYISRGDCNNLIEAVAMI